MGFSTGGQIGLTPKAERLVGQLGRQYEDHERVEAPYVLIAAVDEARRKIARNPVAGRFIS